MDAGRFVAVIRALPGYEEGIIPKEKAGRLEERVAKIEDHLGIHS